MSALFILAVSLSALFSFARRIVDNVCRYVNYTTQERAYKASFFEYVNAFKLYGKDEVVPVYSPKG